MAEADVNPSGLHRSNFFCYTCNARFRRIQEEDYTCPTCGGGFVEEIPEHESRTTDIGHSPFHDPAAALVSTILSGERGPGQSPSPGQFFDMMFGGGFSGGSENQPDSGAGGPPGSGNPVRHTTGISFTIGPSTSGGNSAPMDHVFESFLSNLIVGLGGQVQGQGLNLFGNLGDYVWGRDGLDAIVTQLMNQMEGSGPPPLDPQKLEHLRTIKIQDEHVAQKLECSVCWDDFHLDEEVKQLDCEHVYHPACIIPWLKLHGTCPICRRDFTEGGSEGGAQGQSSMPTNMNPSTFPLNLLQRQPRPGRSPSASAVSPSSSTSVPPATGRSSDTAAESSADASPTRQGYNMDYDMEFD